MGGGELTIRRPSSLNVSQEAARATLREVRLQGHTYVELREVGRRTIFFCTLCLTPCYSDTVLFDHLRGNLHSRRYAAAKATLFGPVPWPFNDGVLFFSAISDDLTVNSPSDDVDSSQRNPVDVNGKEELLNVPRGLSGDSSSSMKVFFTGYGHIASRISKMDDGANKICRIWCAWLGAGESDSGNALLTMPRCDFGVVNFSYSYDLGRPCGWDDAISSVSSGSCLPEENLRNPKKFRKSPEDTGCVDGKTDDDDGDDDDDDGDDDGKNGCSLTIANRNFRRELRRRKRLAAERMCDICGQSMLKSKDVAALLNRKTWNIACSSRNTHGAFHVFHTSCLIHWILLCESEFWNPKLPNKKSNRGRKGKKAAAKAFMSSILCPECQGTGINTEEENLEKPSIPLSQMFQYKLKAIESHKAWMKSPETLEHCSTGLSLSNSEENAEEQVLPAKLLHFYQARYMS
ncbi:acyl-UDP-N-acetylglucosamine O-acyltransferase [Wolffia australiana]